MKRVISLFLVLVLLLGPVVNVFAENVNITGSRMEQMEKEINFEIEIARKEIYRQLEEQDALILIGVYEDLFYPQIERQIRAEYMGESTNLEYIRAQMWDFYAPNGGILTYLSPLAGYKPTEVAITCLNRDDSYSYILYQNSITISSVLLTILGYVPYVGDISGLLLDINGTVNSLAMTRIKEAGGCAQIVNTYSREFGTKASLVSGWSNRYYISIPNTSTNAYLNKF